MRVAVVCEFSGIVRDAFRARGHDAMSYDLLDTERPGPHFKGDVMRILESGPLWDLMIAHPPCQYLTVSGALWMKRQRGRLQKQIEGFEFFMRLALANVPRICLENPVGVVSTRWRKPDQIIQPWQFGHPENKKTCLWLKGLPPLIPTNNVRAEMANIPERLANRVHHAQPGPERWKERSRTFQGIADAMADQWGHA